MRKISYGIMGLVVFLVISLVAYYSGLAEALSKIDSNWAIALINCIATAVLASVAFINMTESKKVRAELVRPRLALEPSYYEYDKTGEIIGFNCLNLVNGGAVARDIEIDVTNGKKPSFLYASSLGTNDRIQILSGKSSDLGGIINVTIRYRNMYNKLLEEVLSLDLESINKAKRKLVPVHDIT